MSKSIWIVGAGHMGRSALAILAEHEPQWSFTVVDRDAQSLAAAAQVDPARVRPLQVDVSREALAIEGADVVLNMAGPFFAVSTRVAEAALAAGVPYLDIADDVEATESILALDEAARAASTSLVTGAGLSPGVSNWMAATLVAEYPEADELRVAWATHEPDPGGLAPLRHMLHMAVVPALNIEDGEPRESVGFRPETAGEYDFPAPLGRIEAYDTAHPEPLTLHRRFPHLRRIVCQGSLRPAWANAAFSTLGRIGFGYGEPVEIHGVSIEPAEFLWQLMWQRHRARNSAPSETTTAVHVVALADGEELGARSVIDHDVMAVGTGLGAAAAVLAAIESGIPDGAHGPEAIDAGVALAHFTTLAARRGAFTEGILAR
ncbi:MAG: saccharopine dehydrogenase [Microbacteriaceae bacterium]|nr:MAG: saccharopine dehydrogenase [Microbacteriaceae bacterium]